MVVKNFIYNLIYQIIVILIPVITIPYVSRVLGAEGLGVQALTSTYAQYFLMLGMLGLSLYSSREISYVKDNKNILSRTFWELNILRFITVGISIIMYLIIFGCLLNGENKSLIILQVVILINGLLDISWLFIGLENFKNVVIKNTLVKLVGLVLIFLLVKESTHVWRYALIISGTQLIGNIIMWFEIPKEIKFSKPSYVNILNHLNNSIKLFIPQIAITIYTMLDKVMLGVISTNEQVGLYDNSQKIIKILVVFVTMLATVTVPKMANLYANGKIDDFKENIYKSFSVISFIAFPISFGLIGITDLFIPWFYGDGFKEIKQLFYVGAFLIITLGWTSILGTQVLISMKKEKEFTISVTIGAILNLIFNFLLINEFKSMGTMISSVIAEYSGMIIMLYFLRDFLDIKRMFKDVPKYLISSFIMFVFMFIFKGLTGKYFIDIIIQVIIGCFTYGLIMIITNDYNLKYVNLFIRFKVKNKVELGK